MVDPRPFIAIDFETSGTERHYACSVGLVRVEGGRVAGTWRSLLRPPSSYVRFTDIHGLTWEMLRDAPTFREAWPAMSRFWTGAVGFVAHNAPFDRSVLEGCCEAFGCPCPTAPFYCTVKGSRRHMPLPSHRLDSLCAFLRIELDHHEALSDALACARIFLHLQAMGATLDDMRVGAGRKRSAGVPRTMTGRLPI